MFSGCYNSKMDDKGRVIVPMKLREELGVSFAITLGLDGCLFLFSKEGWKEFLETVGGANTADAKSRKIRRYFLGNVSEGSIDKQGRMLIPQGLRGVIKDSKDLTLLGMGKQIEIWDKADYDDINITSEEAGDLLQSMDISI